MNFPHLLRVLFQAAYLVLILLAIPLAFDVSGERTGVAFTLLLTVFYFCLSSLRVLFHNTKLTFIGSTLYYGQFLIVPSLLLLHLTFFPKVAENPILVQLIKPWEFVVVNLTGLFAVLEGFCTLLVIQSTGQFLKERAKKSDIFEICVIIASSLALAADLFLVIRIYSFPEVVGAATATLIGAALTVTFSLGIYGIMSKRGSVAESTMLFTYIVYVIYLTFTDFQSSNAGFSLFPFRLEFDGKENLYEIGNSKPLARLRSAQSKIMEPEFGTELLLPPVILDSCTSFMSTVAELTPTGVRSMFQFFCATLAAITPSVMFSLIVRLTSFYLAMRIIPYIRHPRQHRLTWRNEPFVFFIYSYAPIFIIAVYTHLLMQHFGGIVHIPKDTPVAPFWDVWTISNIWMRSRQAWQFWGWVDIFTTLAVYELELVSTRSNYVTV